MTTGTTPTAPTKAWLPLAAVGCTLVFWASAFVAIRHLGHDFSPGALSLGRLVVGAACLAVVALARGIPRPRRGDWVAIVLIGVLWFGVYNVALNEGEQRVDAGTAAMLIQVSPVLIALLAAMFLGERFTVNLGVGLALAFAGVGVIAFSSSPGGNSDVVGVLLCLLSAVSYAISLVLQKPLVGRAARRAGDLAGLQHRRRRLPAVRRSAGQRDGRRPRVVDLVAGLPRRVPDRDRVHDVRLRAQAHDARAASASRPTSSRRSRS